MIARTMRSRPSELLRESALAAVLLLALLGTAACRERVSGPREPLEADLSSFQPAAIAKIEPLRAAVREDPSADTWGRLGIAYYANEIPTLAKACLVEATKRAPGDARLWYVLARAQADLGDEAAALAAIERCIALRPDSSTALLQKGNVLLDRGELDAAARAFAAARAAAPEDPGGWIGLARVHLQRDENEPAIEILLVLHEEQPGNAYVNGLLSTAYRQAGRADLAQQFVPDGGGLEPRATSPWDAEIYSLKADTFLVRWYRAAALRDNGKLAEAIPLFEELIEEEPGNTAIAVLLAGSYLDAGRVADAGRAYARALAVEPEHRLALLGRARVQARQGRMPEALATVEAVLARHPSYGRAYFIKGSLLNEDGDRAGALEAYRRSLALDERNPGTRMAIGLLELDLERWDDARATFEKATTASSVAADAWVGLARALVELGRYGDAEHALLEARKLRPRDRGRAEETWRLLESRRAARGSG